MKKLILSLMLAAAVATGYAQEKKAEVGGKLVDIELMDTDGGWTYLEDYIGGKEGNKHLLVYFWTCSACNKSVPELTRYMAKYSDKLEVVGVNLNNNPQGWAEMYQAGSPFPWVNLSDGKTLSEGARNNYPIPRFPTYVLVDKDGTIVEIWSSQSMGSAEDFPEKVKPHLGEPE